MRREEGKEGTPVYSRMTDWQQRGRTSELYSKPSCTASNEEAERSARICAVKPSGSHVRGCVSGGRGSMRAKRSAVLR